MLPGSGLRLPDLVQSKPILRVLMVTPRYAPYVGGTETHTYEVARRLVREGHEVTVLTTDPSKLLPPREEVEGVYIMRTPAYPQRRDYYLSPGVYPIMMHGKWDIVHCQGYHTLIAPLAMWTAGQRRMPYVVTLHSGGHSSRLRQALRGVQWRLLRPLLAGAERVVGVSEWEAATFRERLRLPPEQITVIPNGAQLPTRDNTVPSPQVEPLLLSLGRLERYKGHHRVIEALPLILAQRPDLRLRIVGSGPYEKELRQLAQRLGVAPFVEIGPIPAQDRSGMAQLLERAALVISLSEYESQGIAVVEAMVLERPVLVAHAAALGELADRGLVRSVPLSSSPQAVAAAILQQLAHPHLPSRSGLPNWDDCAAAVEQLYYDVTKRKAQSAERRT